MYYAFVNAVLFGDMQGKCPACGPESKLSGLLSE
jgi:hypothetical protein